jgi:hypothetical protein
MTDTVDPKVAALQFIAQALNDFSNTLPLSARGSFIREAQAAIKALEPAADPPKE